MPPPSTIQNPKLDKNFRRSPAAGREENSKIRRYPRCVGYLLHCSGVLEKQLIHLLCLLLVHLREDVRVGVERNADVRMTEPFLYDLRIDTGCYHGSRVAVAKIVQTNVLQVVGSNKTLINCERLYRARHSRSEICTLWENVGFKYLQSLEDMVKW